MQEDGSPRRSSRPFAEQLLGLVLVVVLLAAPLCVWKPVCVNGGSMRPALWPGDLAVVKRAARPTVGDIVLVDVPGHGRVLHRVVSIESGRYRLRGDANSIEDRVMVSARRVQGVVVAVLPVGSLVVRWKA